jgi:serine protease AprX
MRKSLIAGFLLSTVVSASATASVSLQEQQVFDVPGTDTMVRSAPTAGGSTGKSNGKSVSSVSRDRGRTWTTQGEIDTKLHLRYGVFDPKLPPLIPGALLAKAGNRLFVVQFHTQIIGEFRAAIIGLGAELHHYLPSQSYLVRMDRALLGKVSAMPFVRSVTEYHTAFRVDPEIIVGLGKPAQKSRYTVVVVDPRRDSRGLEARVIALGGRRETSAEGGILFEATLTEAQMLTLADDDRVLFIEKSTPIEFDIDNARIQGGSNYVDTLASIRGIGMTGHISEGVYRTHKEFAAITGVRVAPIGYLNGSASSHGTNTAGEIYARGAVAAYKGLMPNAQLVYTSSGTAGGSRRAMTRNMQSIYKVMLDTASWGYARTLLYTSRSAEMDNIIFDYDMFITQSQSNAGATSQPRASRPQAWAKNICSAGGFRHRNDSSRTNDYWGRSGSTGPASDGRIGVTLSAYYDSIRTTNGSTGYRTNFGGTSGATPIINGLGGATIEMFTDGLFGYGKTTAKTAAARFKVLPHFSTTKALLVANADQLIYNSSGTSTGANRYQQGFGFPSLRRTFDERHRLLVIDELDLLRQGQSRTYYVFARGGRFTAALQYPDPAAAANAAIHRINSVDLSVKTSNGTSYWGNNGLLTGAVSSSGGSANDRDTEECVILSNAPKGLTEVTVRATAIRRDGHVQTRTIDVDYGLVVQGLSGLRDRTGMKLDLTSSAPGNLRAAVTGAPISGWTIGFTMFSLATSRPTSTGNAFGLEIDSLALSSLTTVPSAGNPFAFTPGSSSQYPRAAYSFPTAVALAVKGRTIDGVVILMRGATLINVSNVSRVTVK